MRSLILLALLSVVTARPKPGYFDSWGHGDISSLGLVHQPVAQPWVHAAPAVVAQPVVHAPVALAKTATSYSSFQQVVHPVSVAQPIVHAAPVISQPVVHSAPVVQTYAQPVVQTYAQPVVHSAPVVQSYAQPVFHASPIAQSYLSAGSYGHGW